MDKPVVALTYDELTRLLTVTREQDHRVYLLFLLTACFGLRASEAINLRRSQFTVADGDLYLTLQRLKGSRKTSQKLLHDPDPLFDVSSVVAKYIEDLSPRELLFKNKGNGESLTRWAFTFFMEVFGKEAGLPEHKQHPHTLKHTCGILLRKSGASLEEIQNILGHKRITSTVVYLRVTEEETDAARGRMFSKPQPEAMAAAAGR